MAEVQLPAFANNNLYGLVTEATTCKNHGQLSEGSVVRGFIIA